MYLYTNSKAVCKEVNDQTDEWEGGFLTPNGIAISWRKANMIHRWFVDNVQNGNDDQGIYPVSVEDLVKLHDTCKEVLDNSEMIEAEIANGYICDREGYRPNLINGEKIKDPSVAKELLPTMSGFFYGSEDYDQFYIWDVRYTMEKLEKILDSLKPVENCTWKVVHESEPDWYVTFTYTSSW